jgi:hypothetical protein
MRDGCGCCADATADDPAINRQAKRTRETDLISDMMNLQWLAIQHRDCGNISCRRSHRRELWQK